MAYKEKTCPTCQKVHKKRGPYCSRSCGNHREWTEDQKKVFAEKKREWLLSDNDNAEVERWQINAKEEEEPVGPMIEKPIGAGQFVQDGDLWSEV
jgi:endogenous inhibitor of DNA gyrase (YacG/DUF329 family)